ncbi:hypothetical protein SASPL_103291 [Salvia splendens]|uniref:Uncharacterized protein n=1 Tax=Salvia splendens TaxID=180675 RepID=A0A8X8YTI7_SALSN|nr:uncharacterized protein LOC121756031 isoform X2 [Salvia splendens]KAG6438351.1 hypothetical protein SASPL_103291 [Salvia splendens]
MMGLSSMGYGVRGNSSTSNLSASAPPFTVDRLNPNPSSNPLLHYSDYGVEPFPQLSAIDSNEMISDDYRFSASVSIHNSGYGGDVKPYYSPYVASLTGEDRVLGGDEGSRYNVGHSVAPQHDYARSLFDLEYGPRWVGGLGFDDGKRAKRSEVDGKFLPEKLFVGGLHGYENQLYHGGCGSENRNQFKEDSSVLYKNLRQVPDREVYTGSSSTGYMEDKSRLEQQFGFFHYDSCKTLVTSGPPYPEPYPPLASCATEKNFPDYKNPSSQYEKCIRPVDAPYHGRVSVGRSSPTVVIRPPPASRLDLGQGNASRKSDGSDNAAGVHIVNSDHSNPSKPETSPSKFFKQGNASSASVTELSRPLNTKDTIDSEVILGSQLAHVNVSSGFSKTGDDIQAVDSTEESSDFMDHHSTAVDSPCWKGAPSSPFSVFDIESGNCDRVKVNLVEQYGFGHGEHPRLQSMDSNRVFSEKVDCNTGNENECGRNDMKLGFEKTLEAICSNSEQTLLDCISDTVWTPHAMRSNGAEFSGGITKDCYRLNDLTSVFDFQVSETKYLYSEGCVGMAVNGVSEDASVAVLAAEKVLASPASQEDPIDHSTVPDPRLDVPSIVKSMHSLSELLQSHISRDVCPLGEENAKILEHTISNLSTCLSKNVVQVVETNKPELKDLSGETSLRETCCADIITRGLRMKGEVLNSCAHPSTKCEASNPCTDPGKKDKITPIVSPLRDDFHINGDDDMAKAIKKVLEQNFEIDEDMHSQALLFKNLWLEAEAKLCSVSYKARFERMKAQMAGIKLKVPKEDEDVAEMVSELCISPNSVIMSVLTPEPCVNTLPKPVSLEASASGASGHLNCVESSVLARLNILESREEQQRPEIVDCKHADSITARFNILKSREESSKLVGVDKENPPRTIPDEKHFWPLVRGHSGDAGSGKFGSYFQHAAGSVTKIAASHLETICKNKPGWRDSLSSSEWEHVLKDDFSLKN